jgi:ribosomal protein L18
VFVQLIDDQVGNTLVFSIIIRISRKIEWQRCCEKKLALNLQKKALSKGIQNVVFDRNGFCLSWSS